MIDEVIPIYIHMSMVISDVRKPHWSSECYVNKCGVISYHQEDHPSCQGMQWIGVGLGMSKVP